MSNLNYMNAIHHAIDTGMYHPHAEPVRLESTVTLHAAKLAHYRTPFMCVAMENIIDLEPRDSDLHQAAIEAKKKIQRFVGSSFTLFAFTNKALKKQYGQNVADMAHNPKLLDRYFDIYRDFPEIYEKPESITKYFAPYIYT